ncbi:MAG: hypothetical protein AAB482_01680 [Patescibacteria group bacterium]
MRKPISRRRKYIYGVVLCLVVLRIALSFIYANCDSDWQLKIYSFLQDNGLILLDTLLVVATVAIIIDALFGLNILGTIVFLIILGLLASVFLSSLNTARVKSVDARRVADLRQIQLGLELWSDQNAASSTNYIYPDELSVLAPQHIGSIPNDPYPPLVYDYRVDNKKKNYVLRAFLLAGKTSSQTCLSRYNDYKNKSRGYHNSALDGDLDGTVFGLDCNDPAYCVSNLTQDQINKLPTNAY